MSNVVNRTTKQLLESVNTPDFPKRDWIINPTLSAVSTIPQRYWNITGDIITEMTQAEKDTVDAGLPVPPPLLEKIVEDLLARVTRLETA